jgi:TrkA domain protein
VANIRETELPGIGTKYQIDTRSGDRLVVILRDDSKREIHHFSYDDPEESVSMVTLEDNEARQVAGIIGGIFCQPRALESVEVVLQNLAIDWIRLVPENGSVGRTIGELKVRQTTGASIIAIISRSQQTVVNPGPDIALHAGDTLVIVAERKNIAAVKRLLIYGSDS